ncbi:inactive serine/threonine-protein kinase TEX14-like [Huso huso]|uniref:Inactive serine/threonine-protein kinase TEX14-like n=1 Tax=Huso huso TaxID=61971 RepID=A0ABR0YSR1_HUSHU
MNKTFNISPRVQRSADPGKVEQSSGSDFMPDSSLEVSDEFFTPNPLLVSQEAALHSGRQALMQTPSSEEDLEVTVEVLWPRLDSEAGGSIGLNSGSEAGGSRAAVERPLDTEPNSAVVCASSPVTSSLTDIQDLSSIACDGDSLSREVQQQGPVIRNTVALVSTPCSPGTVLRSQHCTTQAAIGIPYVFHRPALKLHFCVCVNLGNCQ